MLCQSCDHSTTKLNQSWLEYLSVNQFFIQGFKRQTTLQNSSIAHQTLHHPDQPATSALNTHSRTVREEGAEKEDTY